MFSQTQNPKWNSFELARLIKAFKNELITQRFGVSELWSLFNIYFLKKEKIYTKLKYSRVPQYDMVSGGAAALFAGFLGFLICEKFGFELGDSGDFYYLFMYLVLTFFSLRVFLKITNATEVSHHPISFKWFLSYITIIVLSVKYALKTIF